MGGLLPGVISDGPGADVWRAQIPARYSLGAGNQVQKGQVFKRNINAVAGRNDTYPQYSAGDQGVLATNASAGFVAGVYAGATQQNTNNVSQSVALALVRQGITPVRVAALNGGTAVSVGSLVGFSAATGASSLDLPTVQGSYTVGAALGYVVGYQIQTALAAALSSSGSQTVAVANTDGITTATALTVDYGQGVAETVTPSAVTAQVKANGSITLGGTAGAGTAITVTINGVATTYTTQSTDTTLTIAAASLAKAINASSIVQGTSAVVAQAQSSGAVVYVTALQNGTNANSYTLVAAAAGGTVTATASGATLANGTYGTITATFANAHASGATIIGQNTISGSSIIPVPSATGGINVDTVLVDVAIVGA